MTEANAESGPDGRLNEAPLGGPQSNTFVGMNWATLQNTPFQYFKHYTEEGGIASPLIVHWPKGIDPNLVGSKVHSPAHLVDVLPTLLEVCDARYPEKFNGHDIVPMQGISLTPTFSGRNLVRNAPIFWEHEGNRAVRTERWKLVARFKEPWELYDMTDDRSETRNLANVHPDLVRRLAAGWDAWATRTYVDPWRDAYDIYLNGKPRQNWGTTDLPRHPEAMNEMTPTLRAQYRRR